MNIKKITINDVIQAARMDAESGLPVTACLYEDELHVHYYQKTHAERVAEMQREKRREPV